YPAALALRQMSMVHDELPKYLLAPEVSALLHYVPDLRRKMLLATLKIPVERRNKRTGRTEKARIWEV
ncbi:phage integrase family protein, partial [Escherichia coli]|nr:phage integrase family protein [Escherichia coli]